MARSWPVIRSLRARKRRYRASRWVALLSAALLMSAAACRKPAPMAVADEAGVELPAFPLTDDTEGVLFSYVTPAGSVQLAQHPKDVPYESRDVVRVWSERTGAGIAGPMVYVADLRMPRADRSYKVESMRREAFEKLIAARRGVKEERNPASAPASSAGQGTVSVIVYGASWCGACHQAEAYLKQKGVPFVHKDVDDERVNGELQQKLRAAGQPGGSIPVLDVGGRLLIGFSPAALDGALAAAKAHAR